MEEVENQINDLEHKEARNNQSEPQEEKEIHENEDSVSSLWDNFKCSNIHIMGVPGKEKEQDNGNLFEKIMKETFPNLVKEIDRQDQEAQSPNKMDAKRITPRHIIIKMPKVKDKERVLRAAREKKLVTYRGVPIKLSAEFSKETLQARRDWQEIFGHEKQETTSKTALLSKAII